MSTVVVVLVFLLGVTVLNDVILIIGLITKYRPIVKPNQSQPFVSILLAVRNEEKNLERCLQSLIKQHYPQEKMEILIGDDSSTDQTLSIAQEFAGKYPVIKIYQIKKAIGKVKGKANVLAQLAQLAKGQCLFTTDGDMYLPSGWVKSMLAGIEGKVAIVTGTTLVEGDVLQCIEYMSAMALMKVYTDSGMVNAGMGNNMVITKAAYQSVGGFEGVPFSVTEDLSLAMAVKKAGHSSLHLLASEVTGLTQPMKGLMNLLKQRKRWITGAVRMPLPIVVFLFIPYFFLPFLLFLAFSNPILACSVLLAKILVHALLIAIVKSKVKPAFHISFMDVFVYGLYYPIISFLSAIYYFLPFQVEWKNRNY